MKDIRKSIKEKVLKADPTAEIFLFGSRARNTNSKESDWDILVLTSQQPDQNLKNKFSDLLFEIELETGQGISLLLQNKNDWHQLKDVPIYQNIQKDSIPL